MLLITKRFNFEMAHAIYGYQGACEHIHGHSYALEVTLASVLHDGDEYLGGDGIMMDFKELKVIVLSSVIEKFDHKLVLSEKYLEKDPGIRSKKNLFIMEAEPTAENMLSYIQRVLKPQLPEAVKLVKLKLYETRDSYASWIDKHYLFS